MGWRAHVLVACLALSGCADRAEQAAQDANARALACFDRLDRDPEMAAIAARIPRGAPTLAQLSDTSRITQAEAAAFYSFHDRARECRRLLIEARQLGAPAQVPVLLKQFSAQDRVYMALVRGEVSWGEAIQQIDAARAQARSELAEVDRGVRAEADRRAMISAQRSQAFGQQMLLQQQQAQQLQIQQQQQMLNTLDRPRETNCRLVFNQLRCTTF
jgi:hypothetical protein